MGECDSFKRSDGRQTHRQISTLKSTRWTGHIWDGHPHVRPINPFGGHTTSPSFLFSRIYGKPTNHSSGTTKRECHLAPCSDLMSSAMDPCTHPTFTHLMGFLAAHGKGPGPSKELYPVLAMCKTMLHSDILAVSMEAWTEDVGTDPPWKEKTDDRMLWRGKTTGIHFKHGVPWSECSQSDAAHTSDISQRVNLVERSAQSTGHLPVYSSLDPQTPIGKPQDTLMSELNADLVDAGFVDEPIQCDNELCAVVKEEYAFKGRKNWSEGNQ